MVTSRTIQSKDPDRLSLRSAVARRTVRGNVVDQSVDVGVILLDEPTTGLDPQGRLDDWQVVKNLAGKGRTGG